MNHIERAKSIFAHYLTVNPQSNHYYGLIALYGMVNLCEASGDTDSVELTKRMLDAFPDRVEHPRYNFPSYRVGGIAKARVVYTGLLSGDEYERQLAEYADELMSARRSHDGILSMPHGDNPDKVWIDVATAATPFLLFSGLKLGRGEYIDEGGVPVARDVRPVPRQKLRAAASEPRLLRRGQVFGRPLEPRQWLGNPTARRALRPSARETTPNADAVSSTTRLTSIRSRSISRKTVCGGRR